MEQVIVGGIIQAVVILTGAVFTLWLDRKARDRREVEDATLRLSNAISVTVGGLLVDHMDRSVGSAWQEQANRVHDLLSDVQIKSRGFRPKKRDYIKREAEDLQAGIGAAQLLVVVDEKRVSPAEVVSLNSLRLHEAVFGHTSALYELRKAWEQRLETS